MMARINPFVPNSPVNPGMFVGRIDEVIRLEKALLQTRADNPGHFMITGERGIGKSSLLLYIKYVAEGSIKIDEETVKLLIVPVDVDHSTTQVGLIQRIQLALNRQLGTTEPARAFLKDAWAFIQRLRVMDSGISASANTESQEILLDEFAYSLANIAKRTCTAPDSSIFGARYDGVLILIDEADNCSRELEMGACLKLLIERLQRHGCNRVLIGLAGLPELRAKLQESHPSSLRIFEELTLGRLSPGEVSDVIDRCIEKANELNTEKVKINAEARSRLTALSEGYPHFIQQFGYSAFAADTDGVIDEVDVMRGAFGERGALGLIGDRYYRNDFYNKIQSDSSRQILRIMADDLDGWVTRQKISDRFKGKKTVLNNGLKALRDRHIILSKEGSRGVYRLQHKGFALWIKCSAASESRMPWLRLGGEAPSEPKTEA